MPRTLNVLSIEKRAEIIKFTEKNSTKLKKDIAAIFSIPPSTLPTIFEILLKDTTELLRKNFRL